MPGCCLNGEDKHVCMLQQQPRHYDLPPTAGCYQRLMCMIRELNLPSEWHHGSVLFFRSQKQLKLERERQVALGHWFVCHPYSAVKYYWDCFSVLLAWVNLLYMPVLVFKYCPDRFDPFILLCDALTFLHILTKFIIGIENDEFISIILEPKIIAKQYIYGLFIIDLISALPLQCIRFTPYCQYPTHTVWFTVKLLRLPSLRRQWKNVTRQFGWSYVASTGVSVTIRSILFLHWLTYAHFQLPTLFTHYYSEDNVQAEKWFKRLLVKVDSPIIEKYTENLYYVCGICNGVGDFMPLSDVLIPEMLINSIIGIMGLFFITFNVATLLRLMINSRSDQFLYNGRLKELKDYMVFKGLPKSLQQKIMLYVNYTFDEHYFIEEAIMNTINEQIRRDINMHFCKRLVMSVPVFQNMPVALINTIIFGLTRVLYMPGEVVVKCDEPGSSIYLISTGTVTVINSSGREVAHLRDGAFFGETALITPGTPRTATIIALEITEMFKLSSEEFAQCLQPYPHLKRRLDDGSVRRSLQGRRRNKRKLKEL